MPLFIFFQLRFSHFKTFHKQRVHILTTRRSTITQSRFLTQRYFCNKYVLVFQYQNTLIASQTNMRFVTQFINTKHLQLNKILILNIHNIEHLFLQRIHNISSPFQHLKSFYNGDAQEKQDEPDLFFKLTYFRVNCVKTRIKLLPFDLP